jgi:hypothetical protein
MGLRMLAVLLLAALAVRANEYPCVLDFPDLGDPCPATPLLTLVVEESTTDVPVTPNGLNRVLGRVIATDADNDPLTFTLDTTNFAINSTGHITNKVLPTKFFLFTVNSFFPFLFFFLWFLGLADFSRRRVVAAAFFQRGSQRRGQLADASDCPGPHHGSQRQFARVSAQRPLHAKHHRAVGGHQPDRHHGTDGASHRP